MLKVIGITSPEKGKQQKQKNENISITIQILTQRDPRNIS